MLAQRRRGGGHGGGGPTIHANGLLACGEGGSGGLGGGYFATSTPGKFSGNFPFFQPVAGLTGVKQASVARVKLIAVLDDGTVYTNGENAGGSQGFGETDVGTNRPRLTPTRITGGLPLYQEETLGPNKAGKSFLQPVGPIGPVLPAIAKVANQGENRMLLTGDGTGRVLTFGANSNGQCANGWEEAGEDPQAAWESGLWKPQYAPFWVLTGGPRQTVAPGEANVLKGIVDISAAHELNHMLHSSGDVYWAGLIVGNTRVTYATVDPVLHAALASLPARPVEIKAGRHFYALRLANNRMRIVGTNGEGCWGTGQAVNEGGGPGGTADRQVKTPEREVSPGVFAELPPIVELDVGEYSWKALDIYGHVWTCGSNVEGQQGLGTPLGKVELRPVEIKSLHEGANAGLTVTAISCDGEERGNGEFGGDVCAAVMSDKTLRTWGKQYDEGAKQSERGEGTGALGDGTMDNKSVPAKPNVANVSKVFAGPTGIVVAQEPGTAGAPAVSAVVAAGGHLTVNWTPPSTSILPGSRADEGYEVNVKDVNGTLHKSGLLGSAVRTASFTGIPAGVVEIKVIAALKLVEPIPIAEPGSFTASGGSVVVTWTKPGVSVSGYVLEWRRKELFPGPVITTLAAGLSTAGPITALPVAALTKVLTIGSLVKLVSGGHEQLFVTSAKVGIGATSIPVKSATPAFAFPSGTEARESSPEKWHREPTLAPSLTSATVPTPVGENSLGQKLSGNEIEATLTEVGEGLWQTRVFYATALA